MNGAIVKSGFVLSGGGHAALLAFALIPTALGYSVYFTDLPNGVLRIALDLKLHADPAASAFYRFAPVAIPNMTLDTWGLLVGPWVGPEIAVSLLVGVSLILLYTGVQALRAATVGTTSLLVGSIALMIIQSGSFRWGLVNYEIGVGLSLWVMALAEFQLRRGGLLAPGPLAVRSALALLAVMSSIFPFVILGCHAAGRMLTLALKGRAAWSRDVVMGVCVPMILPMLFLAFARKLPPGEDLETAWTLSGKVSGWASLFYVRGPGTELPLALGFFAAVLLTVTTLRGRLDAGLQAFLGLMLLTQLIVPSRLFKVDAVDYRLAQPMALVALASLHLALRNGAAFARWGRTLTMAFVVLVGAKALVSLESLAPIRDLRTELTRDLEPLPAGSRLLVATNLPDFRFEGHRIWHLPLLSVADLGRDMFTPSLFKNFFLHERLKDDNLPNWVDEDELLAKPVVCGASHVVLIGDVSRAAVIAATLPAQVVSVSPHAAVFAIDKPTCRRRTSPDPTAAG